MIIICGWGTDIRQRWREAVAEPNVVTTDSLAGLEELLQQSGEGAIVLLHLSLPDLGGAIGVMTLKRKHPDARFVCLSDHPRDAEGLAALQAGAVGYVNSYASAPVIARVIGVVSQGEVWVGQRLMQALVSGVGAGPEPVEKKHHKVNNLPSSATPREEEIAMLVADGYANKEIARELSITERTVKAHLHSLFEKTGTKNRLSLAMHLLSESH